MHSKTTIPLSFLVYLKDIRLLKIFSTPYIPVVLTLSLSNIVYIVYVVLCRGPVELAVFKLSVFRTDVFENSGIAERKDCSINPEKT